MIREFSGDYRFLSNFYSSPLTYEGSYYPTVEHAFQAKKATNEKDRAAVASAQTAGKAKRLGREIAIRDDWDSIKIRVMTDLVRIKFSIPELREKLLHTGDNVLIEGNTWGDCFWGVCNDVGFNNLGIILMKVREQIRYNVTQVTG